MAIQSESSPDLPEFLLGRHGSARILVAEDPFLCTFLRTVLQRQGHHVITGEASYSSELLREGQIAADLVITNQPEAFLECSRQIPLLYLAACPDWQLAARFPHCLVLRKPFRNQELVAAVEQLAACVVP